MSDCQGMLKIHRAVVAEQLGRWLRPDEIVHHVDENRNNWLLSNLELTNRSGHSKHHAKGETLNVHCFQCVKVIDYKLYWLKTNNRYFCSRRCSSKAQEKTNWPSDDELASLVWGRPVTHLAKELGVSDKAVKKRCKVRAIPTPPRGYWSKIKK